MSLEKNRMEAERWCKTAEGDLDTAVILLKNKKYAHSCFHSHQSAEKAMKAVWYFHEAEPWGHSIGKMIQDLEQKDLKAANTLGALRNDGVLLDRFYIPTRYPNGLPDLIPDEAYMEEDAKSCIDKATKILKAVKDYLNVE
jgi:HEPN domain-containing protein